VGITEYIDRLDRMRGVVLLVWFKTSRDHVTNYALVLAVRDDAQFRTVRVYDGAHGQNEMHRYTKEMGKRPAEIFHRGTLGEGMRTAIEAMRDGYGEMIEGWRRA
jgi:hypothetical protein